MTITVKTQSISWNGQLIIINYGDGSRFEGDTGALPAGIFTDTACARHGLAQKLGDAKSGHSASEKHAEVRLIWASMLGGEFNRKGGGDAVDYMPRALEILADKAKQPAETATVWLEAYRKLGETAQAEARKKPAVKAAIDAARQEARLATVKDDGEFDPFA